MTPTAEQLMAAASALLAAGQPEAVIDSLLPLVSQGHPDMALHRTLAYAHVLREDFAKAAQHMDLAASAGDAPARLAMELAQLRTLSDPNPPVADIPDRPGGRLRLAQRYERDHHRSGWRFAMQGLERLHHRDGVRCEDFLEQPFAWQHRRSGIRHGLDLLQALRTTDWTQRLTSEELGLVPIREPWVGFLHNPPNMPGWFHPSDTPQTITAKPMWRESMETCIGLFTLSEYAAEALRELTGKPVSVLMHPTEIPDLRFDFDRFLENDAKQVIQIGWWLRRLTAIDRLPLAADNPLGYRKLRLVPDFSPRADTYQDELRAAEFERDGPAEDHYRDNTTAVGHVSNRAYDELLSRNIGFASLYDTSVNNAVIECLARATPILVNRLPAVEEYLGPDYPLYFADLAQAAAFALDPGRLRAAHAYLLAHPMRQRLSLDAFCDQLTASDVYRLL